MARHNRRSEAVQAERARERDGQQTGPVSTHSEGYKTLCIRLTMEAAHE